MTMGSASDDEISLTSTVESEQQSEYEVETILAEHEWPEETRYLVQWAGYPEDRSTWEPAEVFVHDLTLLEWKEKKRQIAEGKETGFDVPAWEARLQQLEEQKNERRRRRAAKRLKVASNRNGQPTKGAPSMQGTSSHKAPIAPTSRRPGPSSKSAFFDQVHPARQGYITSSAPKPPVLFGNSQNAADVMRPKKVQNTDKHFNNLSTKWRHEKSKNREPTPNIDQLDLRRPSDWASFSSTNAIQLSNSRLRIDTADRVDTTDNSPTGNRSGSFLNSPTLSHSLQASPVASPRSRDSMWNRSRPEPTEIPYTARKNSVAQDNQNKPISEFKLDFPPRIPGLNPKFIAKQPGRWWNYGELYVSMYLGPEKQHIGEARICGIEQKWNRTRIYKTRVGNKIEVWFQHLCSLDEYHELCGRMQNVKYANGWVEGFDDTEPKIRKAAETLWQRDLVAIARLNNDYSDVLLAYPPHSPHFNFLDEAPHKPANGYLNLTLRSNLGFMDRLGSNARSIHSHLAEVNNTSKSGHFNSTRALVSSGVKPSGNFDVAQENTRQIRSAQIPARTKNSALQETSNLSTEPMDLDIPAPPAPAPGHTTAGIDAAMDLDILFRDKFGITFEKLATLGGPEKKRVYMFYVWFPDDADPVVKERDLVMRFLKKHTRLLYSNCVEVDWERFSTTCMEQPDMQGVVLFHDSFLDYHKIPSFREFLRRSTSCWNISLSQPLKYVNHPLHLQRLFPHGGVFLITEDFMVRMPEPTLIILEWFYEYSSKKFPGNWKMMLRPDILNWLLKQVERSDKFKQQRWLTMYHLVRQLGYHPTEDLIPTMEEDLIDTTIISPPNLPNYGSRTADDSPDIPRNSSQEYRNTDHLAEFFAGWCLLNAHRFRRFTMITSLDPLPRWTDWQHIEIRHGNGRDFFNIHNIDYKVIWAKLMKYPSKSTSNADTPNTEPAPYTPRTPNANPIASASEQRPPASTSHPLFKHTYAQPYQ
ncbi:hypothetical protein BDW59DRAFT_15228 [Aspergillus cavernicola]|uniref:Chromo domain-containing protein n=1 Tax=Aspergillus cavernicola TaxID=176166 RepID=A0ABR4HK02_9EURO